MFRNRLVVLLFVTLFVFVLGVDGCGTNSSKEPGRYYNKAKGFSIKFPVYRKTFEEIAQSFKFE